MASVVAMIRLLAKWCGVPMSGETSWLLRFQLLQNLSRFISVTSFNRCWSGNRRLKHRREFENFSYGVVWVIGRAGTNSCRIRAVELFQWWPGEVTIVVAESTLILAGDHEVVVIMVGVGCVCHEWARALRVEGEFWAVWEGRTAPLGAIMTRHLQGQRREEGGGRRKERWGG